MRWLCLNFPYLALELHGLQPELPQALLDKRQRIRAFNISAADQGIEVGQALATALALSPELVLLDTSDKRTQSTLEQLALWAGGFSARISLCPPQALLLEIASMLHYFGGLEALISHIVQALEHTGYSVRLATGETPRGAQLLAAVDNYTGADSTSWWRRLHELRVDQLQLLPEQMEQLQGIGMRTLDDLRKLLRSELAQRFGQMLLRDLDAIVDPAVPPPEAFIPPERFEQSCELGEEVIHSQALLFPLRRLLAALEGYLSQRQQKVSQICLKLTLRDGSTQLFRLGHAGGSASAAHWLDLCRLRLEREQLRGPVLALQLSAEESESDEKINGDLFASTRSQGSMDELISRLCSRLGADAVRPLQYHADHRPESVLSGRFCSRETPPVAMKRPGWLLERPQYLPTVQRRRLELLSGPERISSGWWEQAVVRDYFVARWPDGRCGWLFREPDGRWFIHGWFG
ncbi:DNA polymerase Y family protein [Marinobacterium sp. D7]|uniref:Y-family DNA polymerase n=1 Tax=Marinobacterium ramblicola TaxID=2849041 RepID=UPI001C2D07BC|nr:DNA polymerase Y family protein [Marinobacterium ramblicola]MBV1790252.1 DNA polymerase Y family protein [Marinobacterium ramblicola]